MLNNIISILLFIFGATILIGLNVGIWWVDRADLFTYAMRFLIGLGTIICILGYIDVKAD